jgi:hypothetical protein
MYPAELSVHCKPNHTCARYPLLIHFRCHACLSQDQDATSHQNSKGGSGQFNTRGGLDDYSVAGSQTRVDQTLGTTQDLGAKLAAGDLTSTCFDDGGLTWVFSENIKYVLRNIHL